MKHKHSTEEGIVSILTVLFLTIILSVLSISFLRVMSDEQAQSANDDLSKSAYASALSGIEDAKRGLRYCKSLTGSALTQCRNDLNHPTCPGALGRPSLSSIFNSGGQVGGDPSLNQRYTCVLVNPITADYRDQASTQTPVLVNLVPSTNSFRTVVVRWHLLGEGDNRDGQAYFSTVDPTNTTANPRHNNWVDGSGNMAVDMLRVQLLAYEPSSGTTVTQEDLNRKTAAAYFAPRNLASLQSPNLGRITANQSGAAKWRFQAGARQNIHCTSNPSLYAGYSCELRINLLNSSGSTRNLFVNTASSTSSRYMLMINSVYSNPHFQVTLEGTGGNPVDFYDVQPEIEVTGAAADVFRRLKARVRYTANFTPKDALQSGASLCKAFFVTNQDWMPGQPDPIVTGAACSGLTN